MARRKAQFERESSDNRREEDDSFCHPSAPSEPLSWKAWMSQGYGSHGLPEAA